MQSSTPALGKVVPGDQLARLSAADDPADGVVVVIIGYRLAGLGYMAMPELSKESPHGTSGNYGLLDQIAALKWIKVSDVLTHDIRVFVCMYVRAYVCVLCLCVRLFI